MFDTTRSMTRLLFLAFALIASPILALDEPPVESFQKQVSPLISKYCVRCHNVDKMTSGVRVDNFTGEFPDASLFHWRDVAKQLSLESMPPENEAQPTEQEREFLVRWIEEEIAAARARNSEKNGSIRRLTVAQYRNTLQDLLGIQDELTDILPADGVSEDGFLNNQETLLLSPLLLESYFEIAAKGLDRAIFDTTEKPVIQTFRMDLGQNINGNPEKDNLILGANSMLLRNQDFEVVELAPEKPFEYEQFLMQRKFRFVEGYQGNATVRGWRDYDSIYHAVFACVRGTPGYPKGNPYDALPQGLALRPAIPSREIFGQASTYGPKSNFKISLRELPDTGRFRITVQAAKFDDALLLDNSHPSANTKNLDTIVIENDKTGQTVEIPEAGIYQIDAYKISAALNGIAADASRLNEGLIGHWTFNDTLTTLPENDKLTGELQDNAQLVNSPFQKALAVDGMNDAFVVPRHEGMNVSDQPFTVSAWIRPTELRQGGIVCLGRYSWTHGWYLDMPNNQGIIRIETAHNQNQSNGTVQSAPGIIRANQWQHVTAVVRPGTNDTKIYVNGFQVAQGVINKNNLDNPNVQLNIGRIEASKQFKGEIDEVRIYRRALEETEIKALMLGGEQFIKAPPVKPANLTVHVDHRQFTGTLRRPAFAVLRLKKGEHIIRSEPQGELPVQLYLSRLDNDHETAKEFIAFSKRAPRIGVHVGLRRDCGSTLDRVGKPVAVVETDFQDFIFEGAMANYPNPNRDPLNPNYLAGMREIGVISEYTDGRDMPRLLVRSIEFEGPYYETWPPKTHRNIFVPSDNQDKPKIYAREILDHFGARAFRRPLTQAESDSLHSVWADSFSENRNFVESIKDALLVALTSPQFLFLIESSESPEGELVDAYELASKLSYFLWNSAPDDELLKLAGSDELHKQLPQQVTRLVADSRFRRSMQEFTSQWLQLDKFDVVEIDAGMYPKLTRDFRLELRKEPVRYLEYLIKNNLPLENLIHSDFILANEQTANYYGLPDQVESGFEFQPVKVEQPQLGGVLSTASVLSGLSNGRESNPVKRGAWLARKIIAEPPADPPPNVPALDEALEGLTLAEKLLLHRDQQGCRKCHEGIDPWGLPFEQFDAGGIWKQNASEIRAKSTLPDETEVDGFVALREYLAKDRIDQVAFSFLKHLTTYAIGRSLSYNEIETLKEKQVELKADGYRMQDIVQFVVTSQAFLEK